jgi:hypothetical protein
MVEIHNDAEQITGHMRTCGYELIFNNHVNGLYLDSRQRLAALR